MKDALNFTNLHYQVAVSPSPAVDSTGSNHSEKGTAR